MSDSFTLERQACRCGERFASLQAHLLHADYGEPLPHDDPSRIGMHQLDNGEWTHIIPEVETNLTKHATPKRKRAPRGQGKPYVPASQRPDSDFERNCVVCDKVFMRPRGRGRPPTKCEECRS